VTGFQTLNAPKHSQPWLGFILKTPWWLVLGIGPLCVMGFAAQSPPDQPAKPSVPLEYSFPPFPDARDAVQIQAWAKRYLLVAPNERDWFYIDDRFAMYLSKWDHDGPTALAHVRFEVTSETVVNLFGFRSMIRVAQIDCGRKQMRWLGTAAWTGNNFGGVRIQTPPDAGVFHPFADPSSGEGMVAEYVCRAIAQIGAYK
jgi:hypothetical protein